MNCTFGIVPKKYLLNPRSQSWRKQNSIHYLWKCKLLHPLWKPVWVYLKSFLNIDILFLYVLLTST